MLTIAGDPQLEGTIELAGSDGAVATATMSGGTASLTLPSTIGTGTYSLVIEDVPAGAAYGAVRIVDGPGLWISAPEYVVADEAPRITVTTHAIPTGMVIALEAQDINLTTERLVPHPLLDLAPATGPSPASLPAGVSRLRLPEGFTGEVRVVADTATHIADLDPENVFAFTSGTHSIARCDVATTVTGDLGVAGVVSAVSPGGSRVRARSVSADGNFSLEVRPGTLVVSALLEDGRPTAASPMLVRARCGDALDLGNMAETIDTDPAPGTYLGGLTFDDLLQYTATLAGDIEFAHDGAADCSLDGRTLQVSFSDFSSDPYLYDLEVPGFSGTGRYDSTFTILDVFSDKTSEGAGVGEFELGSIEDLDVVGGAFSGSIEGELGAAEVTTRFTCVLWSGFSTSGPPLTTGFGSGGHGGMASSLRLGGWSARGQTSGSGEPCRQLFMQLSQPPDFDGRLGTVNEHWAAGLAPALPRVDVTTQNDVDSLLWLMGMQQLLGSDEDAGAISEAVSQAVGADLLVAIRGRRSGAGWRVTATGYDYVEATKLFEFSAEGGTADDAAGAMLDRWIDAVEPLQRAGVCGKVSPSTALVDIGETLEFSYEVTDLAGEAPESGVVEAPGSSCGTFDPDGGPIVGTTWTTTFEGETGACRDERTLLAMAQGTAGEIDTSADAEESTIRLEVAALWEFEMTAEFREGSNLVHSEATGRFMITEDTGELIGAGTGSVRVEAPDTPCVVISESGVDERTQTFTANGDYKVMVSGDLAAGTQDGGGTVRFIPRGFGMGLVASYTDRDCFPPGSQRNEPFAMIIVAPFTLQPAVFAQQVQGFEVSISPAGTRSVQTWPLVTGGSITIEVVRPEPPAASG
ncbi:MAG: hypothetical protein ACE5GC_00025 [Acidimicrobiia bacterium]